MTRRLLLIIAPAVGGAIIVISGFFFLRRDMSRGQNTAGGATPPNTTVIAKHLSVPWEIAFLPDGDMLVTERPGTLRRIGKPSNTISPAAESGKNENAEVDILEKNGRMYPIEGVVHTGESGLLGMTLHPRFSENHWIYLYLTTRAGDGLVNRVERYRLNGDILTDRTEIIGGIPGASFHDGGRIAFSPDGYLFITTGDANHSDQAQDKNSLAGKILRIRDDGTLPSDNPFGNAVWTYGHRNPQGLAWDDRGRLWATEHGRSVPLSGYDEINLIEKGKNYGWPNIQGDGEKAGMTRPVLHSGPRTTWAPAGAAFFDGKIFFGGLRGTALYALPLSNTGIGALEKDYEGQFGRIRAVVAGPDGRLYITTSNTDGRGEPQPEDDRIIALPRTAFPSP